MFSSQNLKRFTIDVIILVCISLIPLAWFPEGYIVTGHDAAYPINIAETFRNRLFAWNSQQNFGYDNTPHLGAIPIHGVEALFHSIGLPLARAQQFSFVFWFLVMGLSAYYFAYSFRNTISFRFFPLLSAIIYIINFYLIALWRYGSITTFSAYCALPVILAFVIAALQDRTSVLKAGIAISLAAMVFNGGGGLSIPLFGALLISVISAVSYFSFLEGKSAWKSVIKKTILLCIFIVVFSAFLNAYWLFPFIHYAVSNFTKGLEANGGAAGVLVWTDSVSKNTSLINLFRLQGIPEWYDNAVHPFANSYLTNPFLITASFLFAPLAYASLLFAKEIRQKKLILYFIILSLIAIFFSAGTHPPTGWLFAQFMLHVPGFVIFRSAQYKFVPALYLSFSVLISFTLNYLLYKTSMLERFKMLPSRVARIVVVFACILFVLGYHWPYFGTNFFQYSPPLTTLLKVPEYVFAYDEWINDHLNDNNRTLILPRYNSSWKAAVYSWKYFSLYSLFNTIRPKPFLEHSQILTSSQLTLMDRLSDEILHRGPLVRRLSEFLGIRQVLVTGDVDFSLQGMRTEDPADYQKSLSDYPVLWKKGPWQLYQIPIAADVRPLYYTQSLTRYSGSQSDIVGAIVNGSNNFFNHDIKLNPTAVALGSDIPVNNTVTALPCDSCILETAANKIEVPYSLILPGSMFYTVKQWKEKPLENADLTESQLTINRLGLSLKRVSDIASLVKLNKSERSIADTADRLMAYWNYIDEKGVRQSDTDPDYSLLHRIEGYIVSEKEILMKAYGESKSSLVRQRLISVINKLIEIEVTMNDFRTKAVTLKQYHVGQPLEKAELFLDANALSLDSNQSYIYPESMEFDGKQIRVTPVVQDERVSLGVFDLRDVKKITLLYARPMNRLINNYVKSVVAFGTTNSCVVTEVANFRRNSNYRIHVSDPSGTPEGAVIFVMRKKNSISQKENPRINYFTNPDVTFPIDRMATTPQDYYFSGIDGDVNATIYYCASAQMTKDLSGGEITLEEIASPSLYMTTHDQSISNAPVEMATYTRINQTKYSIEAHSETWPTLLIFNENYDRKWKLYDIQDRTFLGLQLPSFMETWMQKPLSEKDHFAVNGYGNAWLLRSSPSGRLVLEYYPQQLLYKGLAVSGISLVMLVTLLVILDRRGRKL